MMSGLPRYLAAAQIDDLEQTVWQADDLCAAAVCSVLAQAAAGRDDARADRSPQDRVAAAVSRPDTPGGAAASAASSAAVSRGGGRVGRRRHGGAARRRAVLRDVQKVHGAKPKLELAA